MNCRRCVVPDISDVIEDPNRVIIEFHWSITAPTAKFSATDDWRDRGTISAAIGRRVAYRRACQAVLASAIR